LSATDPFVSVYTITYNQCEAVKNTVKGLFSQQYPRELYEIIVLDDGSRDDTASEIRDLARGADVRMQLVAAVHEADYLSALRWNQCIAASSVASDVFIQVDDVVVRPDFIQQHVKWHRWRDNCLVTGAKFEGPSETWELTSCRRNSLAGPDGAAALVEAFTVVWGASMSFTKEMMSRVFKPPYERPYDELMRGWGFQEIEFAFRMQKAGAVIVYDPAAGVFHKDHSLQTEVDRGLNREDLISRGSKQNERYVLEKHGLRSLPRW